MMKNDHSEIIKRIQDPFFFIERILGINRLTKEQERTVESVWSNKYTEVKSSHSVGKTFIAAVIVVTYLFPYRDTIVLSTAPTGRQVRDLLWAEINNIYSNSLYFLGGKCLQLRIDISPKWFAAGISSEIGREEQSAVKFQGYHAPRILLVADEACGIHKAIWGALDGIASSEEAKILAIGNPSMINVPFHKHTKEKKWNIITISGLTHPNILQKKEVIPGAISINWVNEKINDWCIEVKNHDIEQDTFEFEGKIYKPNNLFRWKVLGEFPKENEEGLFGYSSVSIAMNAEIKQDEAFTHLAIDVARFGDDKTVFTLNVSNNFIQESFHGLSIDAVADKAILWILRERPEKVGIDCDGLGAGVYDIIKRKRRDKEIFVVENGQKVFIDFQLVEIHSGGSPVEQLKGKKVTYNFANLRAQMFWQLRLDLRNLKIPNDDELEEEMLTIEYRLNSKQQILIISKDELKILLGRSIDKTDSLVYCNWMKYVREAKLKATNRI